MVITKTIIVSLEESFHGLVTSLSLRRYDSQLSKEDVVLIYDIFKSIIDALLDKDKVYGDIINEILNSLEQADYTKIEARSIVDVCIATIINKLTEVIPELLNDMNTPKYTYKLLNNSVLSIRFLQW